MELVVVVDDPMVGCDGGGCAWGMAVLMGGLGAVEMGCGGNCEYSESVIAF